MDRVFKRRNKRFISSLLSVVCFYTTNRPDENELIQFFKLSYKERLYTGQRVHKIKVFIAEVIYSARNGLLMAFFIPWVLHIMTYMGRLRAKGVPLLCFRYTKEQRFHQLKYMKEQENASFRSVKRPKRTRLKITLFIFPIKKTYFAQQDLISSFTFVVTSELLSTFPIN